jgi:hypothetical protein
MTGEKATQLALNVALTSGYLTIDPTLINPGEDLDFSVYVVSATELDGILNALMCLEGEDTDGTLIH